MVCMEVAMVYGGDGDGDGDGGTVTTMTYDCVRFIKMVRDGVLACKGCRMMMVMLLFRPKSISCCMVRGIRMHGAWVLTGMVVIN
ncbi:hypothetical protein HanHA300_Chr16g0603561 [Helianthus annuus]|nr:hypothetical protein HanHA300_Chr16g0603561 [Helianthus annuus]KAJ0459893.1 hypothetical protein HanHA89_Chr16g0654211 [Helianthus annuus]